MSSASAGTMPKFSHIFDVSPGQELPVKIRVLRISERRLREKFCGRKRLACHFIPASAVEVSKVGLVDRPHFRQAFQPFIHTICVTSFSYVYVCARLFVSVTGQGSLVNGKEAAV